MPPLQIAQANTAQANALQATTTPVGTAPPTVTANKQWKPQKRIFDSVEMVLVPPGCFMMGSTTEQVEEVIKQEVKDGRSENIARDFTEIELPSSKICLDKPFWIDRTEVPQAQFKKFDGITELPPRFPGDFSPVTNITWFEARDYCVKRGARLPTEAEWEYAARGPDSLIYPWGNEFDSSKVVSDPSSASSPAYIGSIPEGASWVGALDMSGNVSEWTNSLSKPYPYKADDGREDSNASGTRINRGGSVSGSSPYLRTALRSAVNPAVTFLFVGLRCTRSVE